MKKVISTICFLGLGLSSKLLNIKVGDRVAINNQSSYGLSCEGATGSVKFYVEGTPYGVSLSGATIVISNYALAGTYTIVIKAVDEIGQTAERTITLSIVQNNGQVGIGSQTSTGGLNFGQNGQNGNGSQSNNGNQSGTGSQPNTGTGSQPGTGSGSQSSTGFGSQPGTQPSTGTGSSSNNDRLNSLIGNFSTTATTTIPNYGNSGRYSQATLPTGSDPNLVNPTPYNIATNQAQPTSANRNTITPDDVTLRAASERHQNAIKGITNLLSIIDQARANRDKAQNDIQTYTQAYNDAVNAQRNAQNEIITIETKSSQIVSAINSLNTTIDDLKNRINQAAAQNSQITIQKTTIVTTITGLETKKAQLLEDLNKLNEQVGQKAKDLSDQSAVCQQLTNNVNNKAKELSDAQYELANGAIIRPQLESDINRNAQNVEALRIQLQQAEKALTDAKIKLSDFDSRRLTLPTLISNLQRELDDLQRRSQNCKDELARLQAALDALKSGESARLATQIAKLDSQINQNRSQVSQIDSQIASTQGPLADLQAKLAKANEDLTFLRNQKTETDNNLRRAYQNGNDANNRVAAAKQNLDAVVKRFQDESKIVSDATLNLERARAEEALARLGLEELIALYTNALPYAIVPNGNGIGAGNPTGNNPSGSPLGPINTSGNGTPGSFTVTNWTNYLSSAFGAGINPAFPGSVNELFPFNFLSGTSGNQGTNTSVNNNYGNNSNIGNNGNNGNTGNTGTGNGQCGLQGTQLVTTGTVIAVRDTSFDVKGDDGKVYTVQIAPCTSLNANKSNYQVQSGHQAVIKGYYTNNSSVINGQQITCLAK